MVVAPLGHLPAITMKGHIICCFPGRSTHAAWDFEKEHNMLELATMVMPVAAAGWAFLYMLCGGGLGGAILIFLGLKAIGR